jgi:hypothetical protein
MIMLVCGAAVITPMCLLYFLAFMALAHFNPHTTSQPVSVPFTRWLQLACSIILCTKLQTLEMGVCDQHINKNVAVVVVVVAFGGFGDGD